LVNRQTGGLVNSEEGMRTMTDTTPSTGPEANPPDESAPSGGEMPAGVRTWCLAAHLSAFVGLLFYGGVESNFYMYRIWMFLGPLVVYLVKKADSAEIAAHAREALNFQISMAIYALAQVLLVLTNIPISMVAVALSVLVIVNAAFVITAAVAASNGRLMRYPLSLRLVK
jgi:hypothetical protein